MAGLSNYLKAKVLNEVFGGTAFSAPATLYCALFTTAPSEYDESLAVEASGGSYARVAVTNNTTNFPDATQTSGQPYVKSNGGIITFPTATASWGTIVAMGFYDASTSGNLIVWSPLLGTNYIYTVESSTDVFQAVGSSFSDTQTVRFVTCNNGTYTTAASGDTGLGFSIGTTYYIRDASGNTFKIAASSGGAAIDITGDASGRLGLLTTKAVTIGNTVKIDVGGFLIYL